MKKIIFLILIFNYYLLPNEPTVKSTVDKKNVLIGEEINYNLELKSSDKYNFIFPNITDTLSNFEVLNSKIDTLKNEKDLVFKQNIKLITFDSGYFKIPSLKVLYHLKSDSNKLIDYRSLSTNEFGISVNTVEVDTSAAFKDIKPLIEVPFSIWEIIEYIYGAIALILLVLAGIYIYRKYFKKEENDEEELPFDPKIPADVLALEALKKLEKEKLWQNNEFKEYYTKLTDILRIYIYRVFEFDARDMTSSEIIDSLKLKSIKDELIEKMNFILSNADLVKFAKEKPLSDINIRAIEDALIFVENTKFLIKKDEDEE